jgi:hypothetical protein
MAIDFSDYTGLVPAGTVAVIQAHVRFGDGTDNILKPTKNGDAEGLDLELTILEGPYAKQKLFWYVLVAGSNDGQKSMVDRNFATLKKILDSAWFLDPADKSDEARKKRTPGWRGFDGLRFLAEIGIEQGKDGYPDKNIIAKVITRDHPLWSGRPAIDQVAPDGGSAPPAAPQGGAQTTSVQRPHWAD